MSRQYARADFKFFKNPVGAPPGWGGGGDSQAGDRFRVLSAIGCLEADAACAGIAETVSRPAARARWERALLLSCLKVRAALFRLGCASACDLARLSGEQAQGEHAQQQLGCGRGCPGGMVE